MGKHKNKHNKFHNSNASQPQPAVARPPATPGVQPAGRPDVTPAEMKPQEPASRELKASETKTHSLLSMTKAIFQAVKGVGATETSPETPAATIAELEAQLAEALKKAEEAFTQCKAREEEAKAAKQAADRDLAQLQEQELELDLRAESIQAQKAELDRRAASIQEQQSRLDEQQKQQKSLDDALKADQAQFLRDKEDLTQRELNAQAGFVKQHRESLQLLEEEALLLQKQLRDHRQRIANERAEWEAERASAWKSLDEELSKKRSEQEEQLQKEREAQGDRLHEERAKHEDQLQKARAAQERQLQQERTSQERQLQQERQAQEDQLRKERTEHEDQLRQARKEQAEELQSIRDKLEQDQEELRKKERELKVREEQLGWDRGDLTTARANLEQRVEQRAAARAEEMGHQLRALQERLDVASRERDRLGAILGGREEADRRFGQRTPEEVLAEIEALRRERESLKETLASRPGADAADRLRELVSEREQWQAEQTHLRQENRELKTALARQDMAVTEIETIRDEKAALKSSRDLLHAALEELRKDVDQRVRRSDGQSPFPSLMGMDADIRLQDSQRVRESLPDLKAFVEDLQHRIAQDPEAAKAGKVLYYPLDVLRSFIAGLSMSPLLLLQGISGTGKTSLPLAFARAMGAGSEVVEVQAGWRDKHDLIGHFNAFERRFYEGEFLQALYKAQCPRFKDVPFLIVLDEMNLSHPEQYFADLLSAMELEPRMQKLRLMTMPVEPAPAGLEQGRMLPLPQNVWFIGTANHDETTKEFADKTYDRAHVMEFLRAQHQRFQVLPSEVQGPLGLQALRKAFDQARQQYAKQAEKAYGFLRDKLGDLLQQRFRIGLSSRLERQMKSYVPVVVAAGGSLGEATDHILATKLLRKLRNQHDTRGEDLIKVRDQLRQEWPKLDSQTQPARSLELIEGRRKHLGADDEEEAA
jgi:hypothetical protein